MSKYTGKRRPKDRDYDKWYLYFEVSGKNPEDVINVMAKTDLAFAAWLRRHFGETIHASDDIATATLVSDFEFIEQEVEEVDAPARSDQWYEEHGLKPAQDLDI